MAIRLVVFDLVGTTMRDTGGAVQTAMRDALAAAGLTLRDGAMEGITGMAKAQAITILLEGHGRDDLLDRAGAIHQDFVSRLQRQYRVDGAVMPMPGAVDVFNALRTAGVRIAIGTGFSRDLLDQLLDQLGWSGVRAPIDATIASDEVARGRPYPDMIDALRARLGAIPYTEVAKVGDAPADLQEGTMARCGLVVGVASGVHSRDSLGRHPHDALVDSVAEVPALLQQRGLIPLAE